MIVVTHSKELAQEADEIVFLKRGKLAAIADEAVVSEKHQDESKNESIYKEDSYEH